MYMRGYRKQTLKSISFCWQREYEKKDNSYQRYPTIYCLAHEITDAHIQSCVLGKVDLRSKPSSGKLGLNLIWAEFTFNSPVFHTLK